MAKVFDFDVYQPKEIAKRVETTGVTKAELPVFSMAVLGVLAGAFIGLGALYYVIIKSDQSLDFALAQVLGGIAFSLGLILVVVAGAELFTGNNLIVMAWADRKVSTTSLLRNWLVVFVSNFAGAVGLAYLVFRSGHWEMNDGAIKDQYIQIAAAKCVLPFWQAFFRAVLCNLLVCLAIWMAIAGRSVLDKVVAIVFPISAFVAAGFEHCVANMYFIPMAMFLISADPSAALLHTEISGAGLLQNMIPVILGNLMGGSVLVGLVYYLIYLRRKPEASQS